MAIMIITMGVVGAIIGGLTNHLAIKMLFRPYEAVYIGRWKIPFTPGIIPRRRQDLSVQLGRMVVTHLLTPEGVRHQLGNEAFKERVQKWVRKESGKLLNSDATLEQLFIAHANWNEPRKKLQEVTMRILTHISDDIIKEKGSNTIGEVLPVGVRTAVFNQIPSCSSKLIDRISEYLHSEEASKNIATVMEELLEERKMAKGFVRLFIGTEKMVDRAISEINTILHKESNREAIIAFLREEWGKFEEKPVSDYLNEETRGRILLWIEKEMLTKVPVEKWLNKTVREIMTPHHDQFLNDFLPRILAKAGENVFERAEDILTHVDISQIVQQQVESFPVARLEELILGIVHKEFRMITYLGAFLGGMIGLIQAFIMVMVS